MVKIQRKITENKWNDLENELSYTYRCMISAFNQTRLNMKKTINATAKSVTFTFDGLEAVTLKMSDVTSQNQNYAMLHGMAARIGDNAAIQKSAENGFVVTEAMRREAVLELVTHYTSGSIEWNLKVAGHKAPQHPLWQQLAIKRGVSYEVIAAEKTAEVLAELAALG